MADFCTVCAEKMGFDTPDINIDEIFKTVEEKHYTEVICEGCTLGAIARDEGVMKLASVKGGAWMLKDEYYKEHSYI